MTFRFPRLGSIAALLAVAWTWVPNPARAEPARTPSAFDLTWDAPKECPSGRDVVSRVHALAGDAFDQSRLRAVGRVERLGGRYRLTLTLRRGDEVRERKIESASCEDLAGAAAVTLDLLLRKERTAAAEGRPEDTGANPTDRSGDTKAGAEGADASNTRANASAPSPSDNGEPKSNGPSAAGAKAARPAAEPPKSERSTAAGTDSRLRQRRWNLLLRAPFGTVDFGPLERPTVALGVGLGLRYDEWRFVLAGRIFKDEVVWSDALPNVGSNISRWEGELGVCRDWRAGRFEFGPCVNVALSSITAHGTGPHVQAESEHAQVLAIGARAEGRVYIAPWFALWTSATLAVETSRPVVSISDFGEITRLGPIGFSLALGAEWIF